MLRFYTQREGWAYEVSDGLEESQGNMSQESLSQESMFDVTAGGTGARHDGYGEESIAASPEPASAGAVMPFAREDQSLPLTSDDFAALEERVLRAVGLVRRERAARVAAEERAASAEARLQAQGPVVEKLERFDQLEQEVDALKQERDQVRQRVDRLLSQLDALEL